jgi:hypothetical protein
VKRLIVLLVFVLDWLEAEVQDLVLVLLAGMVGMGEFGFPAYFHYARRELLLSTFVK